MTRAAVANDRTCNMAGRPQKRRDRQTLRYRTNQAMCEFDLSEQAANAAVSIALASVTTLLATWRCNPTSRDAAARGRPRGDGDGWTPRAREPPRAAGRLRWNPR